MAKTEIKVEGDLKWTVFDGKRGFVNLRSEY